MKDRSGAGLDSRPRSPCTAASCFADPLECGSKAEFQFYKTRCRLDGELRNALAVLHEYRPTATATREAHAFAALGCIPGRCGSRRMHITMKVAITTEARRRLRT